jgi:hypothetical protein
MEKITPILADALLKRIRQIENTSWYSTPAIIEERKDLLSQMRNFIINHATNKD